MHLRIHIKETLTKLFIISFGLSRLLFYKDAEWSEYFGFFSMAPTPGTIDQLLLAFSAVLGVILSAICFADYLKKCNKFKLSGAIICMLIIFFIFIYWTLDFLERNPLTLLWVGNFTPLTLLFGGILFAGYDEKLMYSISKFSKYVAIVFLGLSLYHTIEFYTAVGRVGIRYGNGNIMSFFIYGFYALTLFVYGNKELGFCKNNKWIFSLTILAAIVAIASVSRGWIIQSLILLLYAYLGKDSNGKKYNSRFMTRIIAIICITGVLAIALLQLAPNIASTLVGRLNEDTRSTQLHDFFSQMDAKKVFCGQGYDATYLETTHGVYAYIDNQILMMLFRYGLLPTIMYLCVGLKAVYGFFKYKIGYGLAAMMWLAALNGLAIYITYGIDIQNLFIMLVIGRALALIDRKRHEAVNRIFTKYDHTLQYLVD